MLPIPPITNSAYPSSSTETRSLIPQNIYDLAGQKTFLFKFSGKEEKSQILVEAGMRIHSTEYDRVKAATPSAFTAKLRKYLRTRRLDSLVQLGIDRVVMLTFGSGENAYHLFLEFYAKGNIVLTDHKHIILAVHRLVEGICIPGMPYKLDYRTGPSELMVREDIVKAVGAASAKSSVKKAIKTAYSQYFGAAVMDHVFFDWTLPDGYASSSNIY
jgi:predicted ribosome quality control (RQC) complex YloA/Tae2 family protein